MKVETCQFVTVSDFLEGVRDIAVDEIFSDFNVSFGDANRIMVDADTIWERVEELSRYEDDDLTEEDGRPTAYELQLIEGRIESLPNKGQTYVDLEN